MLPALKSKLGLLPCEFNISRSYGSYEELLADKEVEAVYIPLPNNLHAEWVKKCADAGKHVLCEKPFALDARQAEEAIRYAEKKGVLVMEGSMYRLHPQWKRAREIVKAGELGIIHAVHVFFTYMLTDLTNIRNILAAGGGGIPDIGYYAVSSVRFLMGREPNRVVSLVSRHPQSGTDVLSSGILDFGQARALFTVGTQTYPVQKVHVVGSDGEMTVHLPFNAYPDVPMRVSISTGVGSRDYFSPPTDQYAVLFEAFSSAIRGEGQIPTPSQDAIDNMKVLDMLFRSEKSRSWEMVE